MNLSEMKSVIDGFTDTYGMNERSYITSGAGRKDAA